MAPGVLRPAADEQQQNLEKQLERQMGCMAGFFQIFDRGQIVSGKRIYGPKRIPSFPPAGSTSPSERSELSVKEASDVFVSSPENVTEVATTPAKSTIALPVFDFKEGMKNSWKLREAPRLSLDSRLRPREIRTTPAAVYSLNQSDGASDADSDKNRRSPSVVARLMGLDALPDGGEDPAGKKAELRRSASESRVSRDLHRFVDGSFFQKPAQPPPPPPTSDEIYFLRPRDFASENRRQPRASKQSPSPALQRRSYFNAQEFFPEPNRTGPRSLYGEIEKRLRMRGIDERAKDLETLKQILEALQLKGLLHSSNPSSDQRLDQRHRDRPIVVMKPGPKSARRGEGEPPRSPASRRNLNPVRSRSPRSPNPNPRRSPVNSDASGRISSVHSSPRSSPRKTPPAEVVSARSPRYRRQEKERACSPAEDDSATTISESSVTSASLFDLERSKMEFRAGRSLLERCDMLLSSIAAFTAGGEQNSGGEQPSPVSVLDSSFLGEESSPSPVKKRSIEFQDLLTEWEDEVWVPATPTAGSRPEYVIESEYPDFVYLSNVLLATERHPDWSPADVYHFLEKHHRRCNGGESAESVAWRRLLFHAACDILDRKRRVSPWESFKRWRPAPNGAELIRKVWLEVKRAGEGVSGGSADDLNTLTCRAIEKDMVSSCTADRGWGDAAAEMSEAVLHIERLVFKDMVSDIIRDMADLTTGKQARNPLPRRKLKF